MNEKMNKALDGLIEVDKLDKTSWIAWIVRVDNLLEAAIEISDNKEDYTMLEILNVIKETLNSSRRCVLEELFWLIDNEPH